MLVIGLAGKAGSGKDVVADYLVERYNFVKFAFSDALYREVVEAFGLEDDSLLRDRATKDSPQEALRLVRCTNTEFFIIADQLQCTRIPSPRQILQWWGTQYRRAQDPDYWLHRAGDWLNAMWNLPPYPELRPQAFVNTAVRFENERAWIRELLDGNVWHLRRDGLAPVHSHESENPLPVLEGERELWNNDSIERLHAGIDMLLRTSAQFVRVEKMIPYDGVANRAQFEAECAHVTGEEEV